MTATDPFIHIYERIARRVWLDYGLGDSLDHKPAGAEVIQAVLAEPEPEADGRPLTTFRRAVHAEAREYGIV